MKFFLNGKDLESVTRDLSAGLQNLSFLDNYQSFLWEGEILAGQEIPIVNELRGQNGEKIIPSSVLVLIVEGPNTVAASNNDWTQDYVYIRNRATTSTCNVKAFFMR